jgi:Phosphotransferase enzyme family
MSDFTLAIRTGVFPVQSEAFGEFLGDLATLGVVPVSGGGRPYGLLKARSNDRWWVIPTGGGRSSAAAMAMFQPVSLAASLVKLGMQAAARLGFSRGWSVGRLSFAGLPDLPGEVPNGFAHCAYFTGTSGPHRKTAIQLMARDGGILGYAKVSRRELVKPYLAREAQMLRRVGRLALSTAATPAVLGFESGSDGRPAVLVTDSRKTIGARSSARPGPAHLRFLREIACRTGAIGACDAHQSLVTLSRDIRLPPHWRDRLFIGAKISAPHAETLPVALAHGDFTPWNSVLLKHCLYVFDWEYASENWPLGYDLVHYVLATSKVKSAALTISGLNEVVAATFPELDVETAKICVLISLLLHAVFYLRRQFDCSGSVDGWADCERRGHLIDACLAQWRAASC